MAKRKKTGRKPIDKTLCVRKSLSVPEHMWAKFEQIARKNKVSTSFLLRMLIQDVMVVKGAGADRILVLKTPEVSVA